MHNSRFVVLTGHLNDYPLSDVVGILRHQRKTGRLLIEYQKGPASFYFQDGELVDAQLNNLSGLQAICVAVAQPGSPFNFNPLIPPPRRSIGNSLQRVVSELLGCWEENGLQLDAQATEITQDPPTISTSTSTDSAAGIKLQPLALPPLAQPGPLNHSRTTLAMAAAGLMMLGLSSVIAVTGGFSNRNADFRPASQPSESKARLGEEKFDELSSSPSQTDPRTSSRSRSEVSRIKDSAPAFDKSRRREVKVSSSEQAATDGSDPARSSSGASKPITGENDKEVREGTPNTQSVVVVMQIENGRVLQASVANHESGMDGYEALALRIARQRRYSPKTMGQETVRVRVTQPN